MSPNINIKTKLHSMSANFTKKSIVVIYMSPTFAPMTYLK